LAFTSASPFLPFYFKHFLLAFFSSQAAKEKKRNHRDEKKCREGKELSFKLSFCPPTFALLFQTLFLGIFFFSNIRKLKKTQRKKKL
jgi:hypothetical protein